MPETYTHPELRNLAEELDEDTCNEIAAEVLETFKTDDESRQEWLSMHAKWLEMYFQRDNPKNPPWEGSSEESVPILAEACNQFHARSFRAMFPGREIIKAIPVGKVDPRSRERAERVSTHMSWQLMVKDKTYKKNKDRLLLSLPLHGSFFTKTFYDPVKKRNDTRNVRASDLVVPYGVGPRDLEDLPRKTEIIWLPVHEAEKLAVDGFFSEEPVPYEMGDKTDVDRAHDDAMGLQDTNYGDKTACKILEQHRYWDLDGDGVSEPYIVWVDTTSEKCLRIAVRYDTDELGEPTNDKEAVECYTHYPFLENPDGFYGLGFGHLLGPLNTAINKLLRQNVDAGTLANVGNHSGFISQALSLKKGEIQFQLGKFVTVPGGMEDFQRGIYQFKFPGPNATNAEAMQLLMARSDRLGTVTEAITGQTDKVMQPTTILALIEQSGQIFSTIYERILGSWGSELEKIYRLNRKHMDPGEYFAVLDVTGVLKEASASREDYADDHQILPIADPRMTTEKQKLAHAEAEYRFAMQNPLILNSPHHFYNASRRYLKAIGTDNTEEVLPKPQMNVRRMDDPYMENKGALMPIPAIPLAYPDQDHALHLQAHMELMRNQSVPMTESARAAMESHIFAHQTLAYGGMNGQGGAGVMAPQAGNGMVPGAASGPIPAGPALGGNSLLGGGEPPQGAATGSGLGSEIR